MVVSLLKKKKEIINKKYKECESLVVHNIIQSCENVVDSENMIDFENRLKELYADIGDYFTLKDILK